MNISVQLNFDISYSLIYEGILAIFNPNTDDDILQKDINDSIEQEFDEFVDLIREHLEVMGFYEMDYQKSPRSISRYITFCKDNELDTLQVKCVFYLRVSDHQIPKKEDRTSWNRKKATSLYHRRDSQRYSWLNTNGRIRWTDFEIIVNNQRFLSYNDAYEYAADYLERKLKKYL